MTRLLGGSSNPLRPARVCLTSRFALGVSPCLAQTSDSPPDAPQRNPPPTLCSNLRCCLSALGRPCVDARKRSIQLADASPAASEIPGRARRQCLPPPRKQPLVALRPGQQSSSRAACRFIPLIRAPTAFATRPNTKPPWSAPFTPRWSVASARYATDFIFDLESAGGRAQRSLRPWPASPTRRRSQPNLGRLPYIARYQIHQINRPSTTRPTTQDPRLFRAGAQRARAPRRIPHRQNGRARLLRPQQGGTDSTLQFMNLDGR